MARSRLRELLTPSRAIGRPVPLSVPGCGGIFGYGRVLVPRIAILIAGIGAIWLMVTVGRPGKQRRERCVCGGLVTALSIAGFPLGSTAG